MSEEELEDFVRRGYAALNRAMGDPSGEQLRAFFEEFWHSDGVYVNPPDSPEPGEHRGTDAVRRQTQRWIEPYPDLQIEPLEIKVKDNRAFVWVRFSGHGIGSNVPIAMEVANVITIEDGKIRRNEAYTDRINGLKAAGLSE
jgi:ketosteroid isomerase-like protein